MAETTISAFDARRKFGKLLDSVASKGDNVIVERHGEPVAAVVPIAAYRQWQQQREEARARFFERMREAAERANLDPDEAEAIAAEAVAEVRAARRKARQAVSQNA
jgi:prevent-host-death family protein